MEWVPGYANSPLLAILPLWLWAEGGSRTRRVGRGWLPTWKKDQEHPSKPTFLREHSAHFPILPDAENQTGACETPRFCAITSWLNGFGMELSSLFLCLIYFILTWFGVFVLFWPCQMACRILVPQPGIEPGPLQGKRWILTMGPPGSYHILTWFWSELDETVRKILVVWKISSVRPQVNICWRKTDSLLPLQYGLVLSSGYHTPTWARDHMKNPHEPEIIWRDEQSAGSIVGGIPQNWCQNI